MATVFTDEAMERAGRNWRQVERRDVLTATPDPAKPGGWIVRNAATPYRIEIVNADGQCSCVGYQVMGACKHAARVEQVRNASWFIMEGGKA